MPASTGGSKRAVVGTDFSGHDASKSVAHVFFVVERPSGFEAWCACASCPPVRKRPSSEDALCRLAAAHSPGRATTAALANRLFLTEHCFDRVNWDDRDTILRKGLNTRAASRTLPPRRPR